MTAGPSDERAPILEIDPALAAALTPQQFERARRSVTAPLTTLRAGTWSPVEWRTRAVRLMVLDGMLLRTTELAGASACELLADGDVLGRADLLDRRQPLRTGPLLLRPLLGWQALTAVTIAVLDPDFIRRARPWPTLYAEISRRSVSRAQRLALLYAIGQVRAAEERVRLALTLLAESWGTQEPEGVVLRLRLTHTTLGRLVGAERSTVTLALTQLRTAGSVVVRDDGLMMLTGASIPAGEPLVARA